MRLEAKRFMSEAFSQFRARKPNQESQLEETGQRFRDSISTSQAAKLFLLALIAASITKAAGVSVMETDIKAGAPYFEDAGILAVVTAGIYAMEKLANRVRSNRNQPKP